MSFLLDTNVISEWVKARPNPGIAAWLADVDEGCVYTSVVTLAELRHGIERTLAGRRRKRLDDWLREELPSRFEDRGLGRGAQDFLSHKGGLGHSLLRTRHRGPR